MEGNLHQVLYTVNYSGRSAFYRLDECEATGNLACIELILVTEVCKVRNWTLSHRCEFPLSDTISHSRCDEIFTISMLWWPMMRFDPRSPLTLSPTEFNTLLMSETCLWLRWCSFNDINVICISNNLTRLVVEYSARFDVSIFHNHFKQAVKEATNSLNLSKSFSKV